MYNRLAGEFSVRAVPGKSQIYINMLVLVC